MATARELPLNLETTEKFVKLCASTFGWEDLSEDIVMDLGCGKGLHCARALLENFPNVKSIIALDGNPKELEGITFKSPRITQVLADILKRRDIHQYEGKVDKVISTHVLHQISNKEKVFKNVYRLLYPGGEAAFLFTSDFGLYHVLNELRRDSRFKDYFKGSDIFELYSSELKADNYREMLEKIGFKVIEIAEEKDDFSSDQFVVFERTLFNSVAKAFSVPSELVPEINDSASHLYRTKYLDQKSIYAATEMSIFVTKPSDADTRCSSS
ncbi:unnamed protein product [Larinioides sclopetarius]|uniref:Methyltransferase domain-containing protein n=1 Tax=Larinioides sclopetarius TaxID=280406 RepID=A0AAV1ZQE7_9ARAC